jgi:hypothetical protein
MAVEIAIGAFADAKRPMDVERERLAAQHILNPLRRRFARHDAAASYCASARDAMRRGDHAESQLAGAG